MEERNLVMNARAALDWVWSSLGSSTGVTLQSKPLPEPELLRTPARPMTGFFSTLSAEQKKKALSYTGEEVFGNSAFKRAK